MVHLNIWDLKLKNAVNCLFSLSSGIHALPSLPFFAAVKIISIRHVTKLSPFYAYHVMEMYSTVFTTCCHISHFTKSSGTCELIVLFKFCLKIVLLY